MGHQASVKSAASPQLASFKLEEGWLCYEDPAPHCISRREPKHPLAEARFYHLHTLSFLWSLPTAGSHRSCIWNAQLMAAESKPLWAVAYIPLKVINYLLYFISLIINCHLQHFQFHDLLDRLFFFFVVVVFPK